jgi:hypothetical protein
MFYRVGNVYFLYIRCHSLHQDIHHLVVVRCPFLNQFDGTCQFGFCALRNKDIFDCHGCVVKRLHIVVKLFSFLPQLGSFFRIIALQNIFQRGDPHLRGQFKKPTGTAIRFDLLDGQRFLLFIDPHHIIAEFSDELLCLICLHLRFCE